MIHSQAITKLCASLGKALAMRKSEKYKKNLAIEPIE